MVRTASNHSSIHIIDQLCLEYNIKAANEIRTRFHNDDEQLKKQFQYHQPFSYSTVAQSRTTFISHLTTSMLNPPPHIHIASLLQHYHHRAQFKWKTNVLRIDYLVDKLLNRKKYAKCLENRAKHEAQLQYN